MNIQKTQFLSIEQLQDSYLNQSNKTQNISSGNQISFQDVLKKRNNEYSQGSEIKFSKHAASRLETRKIELSDNQVARLQDGMQRANEKGIKDSLVIMDKLAFIVNVPSATVVTAMDQLDNSENIFTNIDGAVIV